VVVVSPEEHDRLAAEVSHLPHLLAALLVDTVSSRAIRFAASGFLDTTRVTQGDPALWAPIILENRLELLRSLSRFEKALKQMEKILGRGQAVKLRRLLSRAQGRRSELQ
jgi:prephenate dehydrogenase